MVTMEKTEKTQKEAPILAAEFAAERELWAAVRALEERRIGRDFIGVFIGENGFERNGSAELHLLSVLAPTRLHEEIRDAFIQCGATAVGNGREIAGRHGVIPHPGAQEDHDMKLPMGAEYPQAGNGRRNGG